MESVKKIYLPKEMRPGKEIYENLGFTFEEMPGDDVLYRGTMPEGWKLKKEDTYWSYFYDEKGNRRGNIFYKPYSWDRNAQMNIYPKYTAHYYYAEGDRFDLFIVAIYDSTGKVVHEFGKCDKEYGPEFDKLMKQAKKYLKTNYPNVENCKDFW